MFGCNSKDVLTSDGLVYRTYSATSPASNVVVVGLGGYQEDNDGFKEGWTRKQWPGVAMDRYNNAGKTTAQATGSGWRHVGVDRPGLGTRETRHTRINEGHCNLQL